MTDPKIEAVNRFFTAHAAYDLEGIRDVPADDVQWTIPGHHPLSGTTQGVGEVDTLRALVWHFTPEGKADRVPNLSGDQHRTDAFV